ncbi:MAG: hypothetical protein QXX77_10415 [Candidatus Methanosuratincola sp.]
MARVGNLTWLFLLMLCATPVCAYAAEGDVLSLDKTLLIQMVIFVLAIFVLNALLFRPLLELAERRRQLTIDTVAEAEELERRVGELVAEYEGRMLEARGRFFKERDELKRKTHMEALEIIEKARREAHGYIEEARVRLVADTTELREKLKLQVRDLARDVAATVLGRELE